MICSPACPSRTCSTTSTLPRRALGSSVRSATHWLPIVSESRLNWIDRLRAERGLGDRDVRRARTSNASGKPLRRRRGSTSPTRWPPGANTPPLLTGRADSLTAPRFDAIRFRGPGTDLTVGLLPASGGGARPSRPRRASRTSRTCRPKRCSRAPTGDGPKAVVRSTYPLVEPGTSALVVGLEVRFEGGRIVDVRSGAGCRDHAPADRGRRTGVVPRRGRARRRSSRVKQTGIVFNDTLFDENATCHIAYGSGLPMAVDGPTAGQGGSSRAWASTSPASTPTS